MHILFIHPNYPAQFGHVAHYLMERCGFRVSFLTRRKVQLNSVAMLHYQPRGGASSRTNFCSRSFENYVWNSGAVFSALLRNRDVRPDVVIAHSGFGTSAFIKHVIDAKVLNYCEFFYNDSPDFQPFRPGGEEPVRFRLRSRVRNAMMLLDLHSADRAYCPTEFQRGTFPQEYQSKLATIPDPIDTSIWKPQDRRKVSRKVGSIELPVETKIVTYVSRGFERLRGFDVFVQVADKISRARNDVGKGERGEGRKGREKGDIQLFEARRVPSQRRRPPHNSRYDSRLSAPTKYPACPAIRLQEIRQNPRARPETFHMYRCYEGTNCAPTARLLFADSRPLAPDS